MADMGMPMHSSLLIWIGSKHSVSGILCVNHPSPQLLQKVHTDARMRLYEYQISYTER